MIFDGIVGAVADFFGGLVSLLPSWTVDLTGFTSSVGVMGGYIAAADKFVPVADLFLMLGLVITFAAVMLALYWTNRIINLIRGAG